MSYDVFLSYRREAGPGEARVLQSSLQARGKQCFLDVTEMGADGSTLLLQVAQIPNFLVILSPGALDQSADPQDWLRQEIGQALRSGSNIIPVMLPGFVYPQNLPDDIRGLSSYQGVEYNLRAFDSMLAAIMASIGSTQVVKPQYVVAATPGVVQTATAPANAPSSFNWTLAGLVFLAAWLPTIPLTFIGSSGEIFRVFGYSLGESCLIALGTTIISQKVRNPFAISALCGLNQLLASYLLGILFFQSFRMYGFGVLSLLYGAVVTGSIGLARFPDVPRWALLAGPLAGTAVYSTLAVVLAVPGFGLGWPILIELMSAAMMGAAFFFAIRSEDMVVQNVKRV
jgi:hypothetical protein